MVVARTAAARRALQELITRREVRREYLALVEGRPPAQTGTIDAPIGRDERVRTRMAVGGAAPREARTHFEIERELRDHLAAATAARERTHAPDPRAPAGNRPSGGRRPRVRARRACSNSTASSSTRRALRFTHPFEATRGRRQLSAARRPCRGARARRADILTCRVEATTRAVEAPRPCPAGASQSPGPRRSARIHKSRQGSSP